MKNLYKKKNWVLINPNKSCYKPKFNYYKKNIPINNSIVISNHKINDIKQVKKLYKKKYVKKAHQMPSQLSYMSNFAWAKP